MHSNKIWSLVSLFHCIMDINLSNIDQFYEGDFFDDHNQRLNTNIEFQFFYLSIIYLTCNMQGVGAGVRMDGGRKGHAWISDILFFKKRFRADIFIGGWRVGGRAWIFDKYFFQKSNKIIKNLQIINSHFFSRME